jgi:RNA polymerase sigma-70 factor (ECF subfamily)
LHEALFILNTKSETESIISRVSLGDEVAFRQLFELYSNKIFGFVFKLAKSKVMAEEVVQDVFMKVWMNRESLRDVEYFPAYLSTIAKNHAFNLLKRKALEEQAKLVLQRDLPQSSLETEERIAYRDYNNILKEVVSQMPPQQQKVYKLCHKKGFKYEEVAVKLNISKLTVKTHMQKAIRTIKSHFEGVVSVFLLIIFN